MQPHVQLPDLCTQRGLCSRLESCTKRLEPIYSPGFGSPTAPAWGGRCKALPKEVQAAAVRNLESECPG